MVLIKNKNTYRSNSIIIQTEESIPQNHKRYNFEFEWFTLKSKKNKKKE